MISVTYKERYIYIILIASFDVNVLLGKEAEHWWSHLTFQIFLNE